jgi:hypothetical protein
MAVAKELPQYSLEEIMTWQPRKLETVLEYIGLYHQKVAPKNANAA